MVKTVCVCPVHRLESNVRPLSFRGWIQDMSGDTSSCLGEWISFASALGLANFLGHQFRGVLCPCTTRLPPLQTEVKCHAADLVDLWSFSVLLVTERGLTATWGISVHGKAYPVPHQVLRFTGKKPSLGNKTLRPKTKIKSQKQIELLLITIKMFEIKKKKRSPLNGINSN